MARDMQIIQMVEAGIRAEAARQKAIATNIANMNSPGYRRIDVRFEELLAKALKKGDKVDVSTIEPEVYEPNMTNIKANGNDVSLDMEVGEMVKNSLRHKLFAAVLRKKYQQMQSAIR
jgi:flagellar basal-body rod protein FlgB